FHRFSRIRFKLDGPSNGCSGLTPLVLLIQRLAELPMCFGGVWLKLDGFAVSSKCRIQPLLNLGLHGVSPLALVESFTEFLGFSAACLEFDGLAVGRTRLKQSLLLVQGVAEVVMRLDVIRL